MFTLRCTQKLLKRMGRPSPALVPTEPTTRLGDWCANLVFTPAGQLVLAVSERTLLPILVPAREARTLHLRIPVAVGEMLLSLGISPALVDAELEAMREVIVANTENRRVLGSMNDFAFMLRHYIDAEADATALIWARRLAEAPCGPIAMQSPDRATAALFATRLH